MWGEPSLVPQSPVNGHLACFQAFAVIHYALMNRLQYMPFCIFTSVYLWE